MADLYPAHLPFAPDFKTAAEAKAWALDNFGTDLRFSADMDEKDKIANVVAISQELLRHKEAGVKIPSSINLMSRGGMGKIGPASWLDRAMGAGSLGLAAVPKGRTDPAVWLNGAYPDTASEGVLRHEIGHVNDWSKLPGRSVQDREFVANTYRDANDPRIQPPDSAAMARYEAMGGPAIPRMLPQRRAPKEPSLIDHMVNLLRGK
jgi:hypothetical protein